MFGLIEQMFKVLNIAKDFLAGYKGSDASMGYLMIRYKDKRYAVKIVEMDERDQEEDAFEAVDNVPKYFEEDK